MKRVIFLICLFNSFLLGSTYAQELQFTVNLNYDQLVAQQKTDPASMTKLQAYISDFLNNTSWTRETFAKDEKIKCKLNINLTRSLTQGSYEGNAQLVISRPVFNSNYETVLFSYVDRNFTFNYLPTAQLYFNENSYTDELPFILAFYAYTALVFDYDSFSKLGGSPYLQRAFNLSNLAANASSPGKGWDTRKSADSRNRYWLIENLMSQQFIPFREGLYAYYRQGLDVATENPAQTRSKTMELLNSIKTAAQLRPGSVVVNSFFDSKSDEIFRILKEASPEEKKTAQTILVSLDPTKTQLYQQLTQ
jgi:Flp pilus assembly protein TadG